MPRAASLAAGKRGGSKELEAFDSTLGRIIPRQAGRRGCDLWELALAGPFDTICSGGDAVQVPVCVCVCLTGRVWQRHACSFALVSSRLGQTGKREVQTSLRLSCLDSKTMLFFFFSSSSIYSLSLSLSLSLKI